MLILDACHGRFFAVDTTNASSPDLEVNTRLCDCSGHGVCIFNEPADQQPVGAVNFNIVTCNCSVGWEGTHLFILITNINIHLVPAILFIDK